MSSPTLDITEAPPSPKDVIEDNLQEVKKLISPLPDDEQAALDAARVSENSEAPAPANALDDMLEHGTLLTDTNMHDPAEMAMEIANILKMSNPITKFGLASYFTEKKEDSVNDSVIDSVRAANDNWMDGGCAFATFETDVMKGILEEHKLTINTRSDDAGRTFYQFDNGINMRLTAVVFEVKGIKMVKLQNIILPLETLFSLKRCLNLPESEEKGGQLTLRSMPTFQGGVECTFDEDVIVKIPGVSVDSLMVVISHLSQIYVQPAVALPAATQSALIEQPNVEEVQENDELWLLLSHSLIAAASFGLGLLIGRYV